MRCPYFGGCSKQKWTENDKLSKNPIQEPKGVGLAALAVGVSIVEKLAFFVVYRCIYISL